LTVYRAVCQYLIITDERKFDDERVTATRSTAARQDCQRHHSGALPFGSRVHLLRAIRERDVEAAAVLIAAHVIKAKQNLLTIMARDESSATELTLVA